MGSYCRHTVIAALCVFMAAASASASSAVRPSYNRGIGFFVLGGKLYDANGAEFRIRGIDKVHWDNSAGGLANTHANTIRWVIDFTRDPNNNVALLRGGPGQTAGTIYNNMIVMPGAWYTPAGGLTCSSNPSILASAVSVWVAQAAAWTQIERYSIINIANEWGPSNSTVWRDSYISAIASLRAAGYHATISVTSGGCGQDPADLLNYAQAVFDSDPEKNVIFDQHIYGNFSDAVGGAPPTFPGLPDLASTANALKATDLVVIFGEYGPGRNIGPSPTVVTPTRVIQIAEGAGVGWLAWAWDDLDLPNGMSDDNWFALSYSGAYNSSADLTIFGKTVVEDPIWGLKALASPASIFSSQATVPAAAPAALALLAVALLALGLLAIGARVHGSNRRSPVSARGASRSGAPHRAA